MTRMQLTELSAQEAICSCCGGVRPETLVFPQPDDVVECPACGHWFSEADIQAREMGQWHAPEHAGAPTRSVRALCAGIHATLAGAM